MVAPSGSDRVTEKVSSGSNSVSAFTRIVIVAVAAFSAKGTVPVRGPSKASGSVWAGTRGQVAVGGPVSDERVTVKVNSVVVPSLPSTLSALVAAMDRVGRIDW